VARYEENTLRRPSCFGDEREHDENDRICRNCRWQATCAVIVKNNLRDKRERDSRRDDRDDRDDRRSAGRKGPGNSIAVTPDPESFVERNDEALGFFEALMFNGALAGIRAGMVEGIFAMDQIPRAPYRDPFKHVFEERARKPKRSTRHRDEDEEEED